MLKKLAKYEYIYDISRNVTVCWSFGGREKEKKEYCIQLLSWPLIQIQTVFDWTESPRGSVLA